MNMRKTILFLMMVVMALTLMGGLALAGGWTEITYLPVGTGNLTNPDIWNATGAVDGHPHGNFQTTSNKCRVCHAVHNADGTTWRLLQNASGAASACDACHGATGSVFTNLRPYDNISSNFTTRGEHTLGGSDTTAIPDSTSGASLPDGGLVCNTCHSVHGAGTLMDNNPEAYAVTSWDGKILRKDPNRDGTELARTATGAATSTAAGLDSSDAVKSGFCADCHTKNPNWNLGGESNEDGSDRLNKSSHVQGPDANGTLSVNGSDTQVAGFGTTTLTAPNGQTATSGCTACHSATSGGNRITTDQSAFPHRSKGSKLLFDTYNGESVNPGDPDRALKEMDKVCGGCHDQDGDFATQGDSGVGRSF